MHVKELYDRFIEVCHRSNEPFIPSPENLRRWKTYIQLHENHSIHQKTTKTKKEPEMEITTFEKLPFKTRVTINKILPEILIRYPLTKIVSLTGSHVRGEGTKESDFDFILFPPVIAFFEFEGVKVDLIQTGRKQIVLLERE